MSNSSLAELRGSCVAPFLDEAQFPPDEGFIKGRFCSSVPDLPDEPSCCLPCPISDWTYPDNFMRWTIVAEWLNVIGLVLLAFMLLSYLVLPLQQTRSHYLSVCLIISVMMICLGFTIPLAASPEQCYNEITPNDMYTLHECAWSGACIVAGGLCAVMWIFIRALSMNLQICWDIVPGRKFFYVSQGAGWGIAAAFFAATITATGVSFRFGNACHVNHANSMGVFWGPLLGLAGAAGLLQLLTFAYCLRVYLSNLLTDQPAQSSSGSTSGLPSHTGSMRTQTTRAVWRRLKKVLWLQWRGIVIVTIILVDVIFFSVVFVYLDGMQQDIANDRTKIEDWLRCLAFNPESKKECEEFVDGFLVNEQTVIAVLVMLGLAGIQVFLFLTRPSIFCAWVDFFKTKFGSHQKEFVSLDARPNVMRSNSKQHLIKYSRGHENTTFEMQKPLPQNTTCPHHLSLSLDSKHLTPSTVLSSPDESYQSPLHTTRAPQLSPESYISPASRAHSPSFPFTRSATRGYLPPEYVGSITPDPGSGLPRTTAANPPDYFSSLPARGLGTTTTITANHAPAQTHPHHPYHPNHNAFADASQHPPQHQPRPARTPSNASTSERRYRPPGASFSTPQAPSRGSSFSGSVREMPPTREGYAGGAKGGLGLNPPDEVEEGRDGGEGGGGGGAGAWERWERERRGGGLGAWVKDAG